MRRIMSKVAALATVVCLLLSVSVTAHAADVNDGVMGEPIAATVLTAEEKAEQELLAKAIVASAQYLKLSVTEMNLKAGESYAVRVIPTELAQKFGWAIDVDNSKSSNNKYLSVQEVNQETMTITFKAEQSGQRVSLNVRLTNPALVKLAENNPALEQYVKLAQSKNLACKVATNNTGTKVIAGLGITTSAPSVGSSSGGSGNNYPVNPGPSIPVPPLVVITSMRIRTASVTFVVSTCRMLSPIAIITTWTASALNAVPRTPIIVPLSPSSPTNLTVMSMFGVRTASVLSLDATLRNRLIRMFRRNRSSPLLCPSR